MFFRLIKRDFFWWRHSPSIWCILPTLTFFIALLPYIIFQIIFLKMGTHFAEFSEFWKEAVSTNYMAASMALGSIGQIDLISILMMDFPKVWLIYINPFLISWGPISLSSTVGILAIGQIIRDRKNGTISFMLASSIHPFKFLLARLCVYSIVFFLFQSLSFFAFMQGMAYLTDHSEWYSLFDPLALLVWFPTSISMGLMSVALSWLATTFCRNNVSEFYLGTLLMLLSGMGLFIYILLYPLSMSTSVVITICALLITLFCTYLFSLWLRTEKFILN